MKSFVETYPKYCEQVTSERDQFGFDLNAVKKIEPILSFLFKHWWRVDITGLQFLPSTGAALIIGNSGSVLPWPGLMLMYALMSSNENPRRLSILCDMDWVDDERLYELLSSVGFVPWSLDNARRLFDAGHLVVTFPEGAYGLSKLFSERYRLREFDPARLLPAIEKKVPVFPMSTLGCDESFPVLANSKMIANLLNLPEYPITPFFPWLPFPASLLSLPVNWHMRILKLRQFTRTEQQDVQELCVRQAKFTEGEIQAELNRLLRQRLVKTK